MQHNAQECIKMRYVRNYTDLRKKLHGTLKRRRGRGWRRPPRGSSGCRRRAASRAYKCATSAGPPTPRAAAAAAAANDAATATAAAAAAAAAATTTNSGARVPTIELLESSLLDILVAFATKWDGGMKKRWIQ